jgi:ankyrin repeat protein
MRIQQVLACVTAVWLGACAVPAHAVTLADAAASGDLATVRQLLKSRPDANEPSRDGTPALHWVVRMQDADTAQQLLNAGARPDLANRYGVRPLHLAIGNDDLPMVQLLLKAGADANSVDAAGDSCLVMAVHTGNLKLVSVLLARGAKPDAADAQYQQTPLMVAAREGHVDLVRLLLAQGAQVNAQTRAGRVPAFRTPGSNAGSKGSGIVRGGWPERGERDPIPGAKTALLYAAREGQLEIVRALIDAGAQIEKADADGVTPLLMAVLNGQMPVAHHLLERGANVRATDWYGQTPLFAAVDLRNVDVAGPTRDNGVDRGAALQLVQAILGRSPDVNARTRESLPQRRWITRLGSLSWVDFTGQTAFLRAALAGDVTVMRLLLEHGADASIATFNGTTPLMAAAGVNWTVSQTFDEGPAALLEAARLAIAQGNDVNAQNAMGLRAIHGAANRGSDDIIRLLVDKGAVTNTPDREGRTPVVWAQGVFLATHPPQAKPATVALLKQLQAPR